MITNEELHLNFLEGMITQSLSDIRDFYRFAEGKIQKWACCRYKRGLAFKEREFHYWRPTYLAGAFEFLFDPEYEMENQNMKYSFFSFFASKEEAFQVQEEIFNEWKRGTKEEHKILALPLASFSFTLEKKKKREGRTPTKKKDAKTYFLELLESQNI